MNDTLGRHLWRGVRITRTAFCFLFSASCEVRASRDWQSLCGRARACALTKSHYYTSTFVPPLPCAIQLWWRRHTRSPPPPSRFGTHTHWTASIGLLLRLGSSTFMGYLKSTFYFVRSFIIEHLPPSIMPNGKEPLCLLLVTIS
jgi:hypothetical protein